MRFLRKHRDALILLGVVHLILFFPSLFMGRVLSPNDILHEFDPWVSIAPLEPQNSALNDISTGYIGLMAMVKERWEWFHWNRAIGAGVPGFGSAASGVLTPLVAAPALLLPLWLFCTGIVLAKLNVSFAFSYLWLREARMRKRGAAAGAITIAAAGTTAVWWLWPSSNAIALYPAMIWMAARLAHGKRVSFTLAAIVGLALAFSGYPPAVLYGFYVALTYFTIEGLRHRRVVNWNHVGVAILGTLTAALIAMPMLASFMQLLRRTGYLEARAGVARTMTYPFEHLAAFFDPYRLGDPVKHAWTGIAAFGAANNFVETTIYVGVVALLLATLGLLFGRRVERLFWAALALLIVTAMFGFEPAGAVIASLPGVEFAPLMRLRFLLPIPIGYLVATCLSAQWRLRRPWRVVPLLLGIALSCELALFAAHYYPYVRRDQAVAEMTPTIRFLENQPKPFRVLPFFFYLLPNTSEYFHIEDVRSHFSSELRYRTMLQAVDPDVWGHFGTILVFHPLKTNLDHPFLRMLGVRYFIEQPSVDVTRWSVDTGAVDLPFGDGTFSLPGDGFRAVALDVAPEQARSGGGLLRCTLTRLRDRQVIDELELLDEDIRNQRVYLRLPKIAPAGEVFRIRLEPIGMKIGPIATLRLTRAPHVLLKELPDGRVFENLGALPRYWAVWNARQLPFERFVKTADFAPEREAIFEQFVPDAVTRLAETSADLRSARIRLMEYGGSRDVIRTFSKAPFLLVSSEKLTPELRVVIDRREVKPLLVNGLFAAVPVKGGSHEIRFERQIGRGFWPFSLMGALLFAGGVVLDYRYRRGRAAITN